MTREAIFFYSVVGSAFGMCLIALAIEWIRRRLRR